MCGVQTALRISKVPGGIEAATILTSTANTLRKIRDLPMGIIGIIGKATIDL